MSEKEPSKLKDRPNNESDEKSRFVFYEALLLEYDGDPRVLAGVNAARQLAKAMETEKR